MTQLVMHIGDPKTGTSSIQSALQKGIVDCDGRRILPWKTANAIPKAKCLLTNDKKQIAKHYTEVRDWLIGRDEDLAVLSAESFVKVRPRKLQQTLCEYLPEHSERARMIAYVRPHSSRFLAAFIQRTKTGHLDIPIGEFLGRMIKEDRTLGYSKRFLEWRRVFGDSFSLHPFVRSELRNQDIITDFYTELLGDESFSISRPVAENVSVTTRALSGILLMNHGLLKAGVGTGQQHAVGAYVANHILPTGPVKGSKPKLDRENAQILLTTYRKDARKLDEEFFSRPIMEENLESSLQDVADEPIDLNPGTHFAPSEQMELERLADEAAKIFLRDPKVCVQNFRYARGERSLNLLEKTKLNMHGKMLGQLDARLRELADILRG
jgi:hypothetical protein